MKVARILINFTRLGDDKLQSFSTRVLTAMKISAYFPTPNPTLADLQAAIDAFVAAVAAADIGGPTARQDRSVKKAVLVNVLLDLANDVTKTAKGDRLKLVSSGYDISPENFNPGTIGLIVKFNVLLGKVSGSAVLNSNGVKNAVSYTFQYTLGPATANSVWVSATFSKAKYTFTGLEPGKEYSFRMIAVGTNGQESYSEIITKMVV